MKRKSQREDREFQSTIQVTPELRNAPRTPLWRHKGYFKKGQLVKRRRTRMETREVADKKWGFGIVTKEVAHDGENWLHVEVYWQGLKTKTVEKKQDIERASTKVEKVTLPRVKR